MNQVVKIVIGLAIAFGLFKLGEFAESRYREARYESCVEGEKASYDKIANDFFVLAERAERSKMTRWQYVRDVLEPTLAHGMSVCAEQRRLKIFRVPG